MKKVFSVLAIVLFMSSSLNLNAKQVVVKKFDRACWSIAYHYSLHLMDELSLTGAERELVEEATYEECLGWDELEEPGDE